MSGGPGAGSLAIGLVVGLAAHVGGYVLSSPATTEPLGLVADLLNGLGWALRTGVVVVVFVQLFPEARRRQLMRALDGYAAALRDRPEPEATRRRGTTKRRRRGGGRLNSLRGIR
jgi:hypothetical protein